MSDKVVGYDWEVDFGLCVYVIVWEIEVVVCVVVCCFMIYVDD